MKQKTEGWGVALSVSNMPAQVFMMYANVLKHQSRQFLSLSFSSKTLTFGGYTSVLFYSTSFNLGLMFVHDEIQIVRFGKNTTEIMLCSAQRANQKYTVPICPFNVEVKLFTW